MYILSVLLLTLVLPALSTAVEHAYTSASWIPLAGKWFAFWAGGVRLFLAGLKQMLQPRFTSEQIFGIKSDDPLPFIQELGMANIAIGTIGLVAGFVPTFVLPAAVAGGLFYLLAGIKHAARQQRSANETLALASDLWVGATLLACALWTVSAAFGAVAP